ncbi:MAG: cation diffusion facilitator family transporter [Chloroflexota bacterium]
MRLSSRPADKQHPFGHGKFEDISSIIIAGLIFAAGGFIAYEAIQRLALGATIEMVTLGIYETVLAIAVNVFIAWYILLVSRKTDSLVLKAQAGHMFGDILSSVAVLIGLVLVQLTGRTIFDPLVALLVACIILKVGYDILRKSFGGIIDVRLPDFEEGIIRRCIMEHRSQLVNFHALRTRRAGSERYADLHLVLSKNASVEEAHRMCDHLEQDIISRLPHTNVTIHIEPCTIDCDKCPVPCAFPDGNK